MDVIALPPPSVSPQALTVSARPRAQLAAGTAQWVEAVTAVRPVGEQTEYTVLRGSKVGSQGSERADNSGQPAGEGLPRQQRDAPFASRVVPTVSAPFVAQQLGQHGRAVALTLEPLREISAYAQAQQRVATPPQNGATLNVSA